MLTAPDLFNPVAHTTMEVLLNSLWQGVLLTALTWGFLKVMRRRINAATRYAVWCTTLLTLVAVPLAGGLLSSTSASSDIFTGNPVVEASQAIPGATEKTDSTERAVISGAREQRANAVAEGELFKEPKPAASVSASAPVATGKLVRSWSPGRRVELPAGNWLMLLFIMWLFVAAARTLRVINSYRRLQQLKRNSTPLAAPYQRRGEKVLSECKAARTVRLGGSHDIEMPMVIGLTSPVILFPQALVAQLTAAEFEQILLHELAHVQRRDDWTNVWQKLIEAILFFHPAVLWIGRHLNLEREIACDDHVICVTNEHKQYAFCLAKLAELTIVPARHTLAPGALLGKKEIFSRVELLLQRKRNSNPRLSKLDLLLLLGALTLAIFSCLFISPVIAFDRQATNRSGLLTTTNGAKFDEAVDEKRAGTTTSTVVNEAVSNHLTGAFDERRDALRTSPSNTGETIRSIQPADSTDRFVAQDTRLEVDADTLLMENIGRLTSSSDKTDALLGLIAGKSRLDAVPSGFFEVWANISSSLDKSRVLSTLLEKNLSRGLLIKTLKAAGTIESNSDRAAFLVKASRVCPNDDAVLSVFLEVVATLRSSSDQERALSALLKRPELSHAILVRTRALALNRIADPESQQLVLDQLKLRLAE
jgi:beta-lactamase regulating signal transducer with metallopeptidase domain